MSDLKQELQKLHDRAEEIHLARQDKFPEIDLRLELEASQIWEAISILTKNLPESEEIKD